MHYLALQTASLFAVNLPVMRWMRKGAFGVEFIRVETVPQGRLHLLIRYIEEDVDPGTARRRELAKRSAHGCIG